METEVKQANKPRRALSVSDVLKLRAAYGKVARASLDKGRNKTQRELAKLAYDAAFPGFKQDVGSLISNQNSTIFQLQEEFVNSHGVPWSDEPKSGTASTPPVLALEVANNTALLKAVLKKLAKVERLLATVENNTRLGSADDGDEDDDEDDESEDSSEDDEFDI